ncbi:MAG: LCP family protein [Chloroflexi bacterium]|nr:LCP family protein [Chloroflexota bacterium]
MSRPDLEPTQRLQTLPRPPDAAADRAERPRGGAFVGFFARIILLGLIVIGGIVAVSLLVTPVRESVLIMGSDARPDELQRGEVGRTDTLEVFVADRGMPRLAMVSVPRDLWVTIPGYGQERINAAYEFGGAQTAKQTVSNVLGQPIDRYLLVGLQGVRDVVNAVGGIDITVPQAIHDDAYPTDDYGYQVVDIPAGRQHMDGDTALEYARTRHQDSDFARSARQQQIMVAVRNAMLNPLNWPRIPAVVAAVSTSIKTDMSPLDAVAIGAAMLRSPGDPDHLVIDTSLATEVTGADGAYLLQAKPSLQPTVAQFLSHPSGSSASAAPVPVSVEVLSAAGIAGLATRTADRLTQAGYTIANVADAPKPQAQTTIMARPSATSAANQIATTLGIPQSRITTSSTLTTADIQITLGPDAH